MTEPSPESRPARRIPRACWWIIGAVVILGLARYLYPQPPHFSGSAAASIDILIESYDFDSTKPKLKVLLQQSITDASSCSSLFALLQSARRAQEHKCADRGTFVVRYANGSSDILGVLPGHDPANYEFRHGRYLYRLSREQLYQVLRDAGIDTTKIPEK